MADEVKPPVDEVADEVAETESRSWGGFFSSAFEGWRLIGAEVQSNLTVPEDAKNHGILSTFTFIRENALAAFLDMSAPIRQNFSHTVRDMITRSLVADPDMWPWVKEWLTHLAQQIWCDVEREVSSSIEASIFTQITDENHKGPRSRFGRYSGYYWLRRVVLHAYLPHNKSFFGKVKDPIYLFILMLTMIPIHGLRLLIFGVMLFFILCPLPPNEYQLMNFILLFKGTQFITAGLFTMGMACAEYFYCYTVYKADMVGCLDVMGPGAGDNSRGVLVDYIGNAVLVWVAFAFLPFSKRPEHINVVRAEEKRQDIDHVVRIFGLKWRIRAGTMFKLLRYDMFCFLLSMAALALLVCVTDEKSEIKNSEKYMYDPQFGANVFWCKVIYSLCAAPFTPYEIPALLSLLTHSTATGFNEHGACVDFALVVPKEKKEDGGGHDLSVTDEAALQALHEGMDALRAAGKEVVADLKHDLTHLPFHHDRVRSHHEDEHELVPNPSDSADEPLLKVDHLHLSMLDAASREDTEKAWIWTEKGCQNFPQEWEGKTPKQGDVVSPELVQLLEAEKKWFLAVSSKLVEEGSRVMHAAEREAAADARRMGACCHGAWSKMPEVRTVKLMSRRGVSRSAEATSLASPGFPPPNSTAPHDADRNSGSPEVVPDSHGILH